MVGAPGSIDLAPHSEPAVDVLQLGGSHSQTTGNASKGATMSSTFLSQRFFFCPCTTKDMEMKAIASTAKQKVDNRVGRRRVGPTCGFVASPDVDSEATVSTL
jgi:hypothetical protein